ncbi:Stabilin-2 [Physocladia obscura]|uniref:Stabilin-2 n=1 Tax=Physocladia obscura TaxID=109957 RepID=A0AAD5SZC8_9FUNG|nr:Stabilin-2 [Physocladia obscura]
MKFSFALAAAALPLAAADTLVNVLTGAGENTLLALVASVPAILTVLESFNGTLFAPTDAALAATVAAGFNASDLTAATNVLEYHAAPGTPFSGVGFTGSAFLTTLQGNPVEAVAVSSGIQIHSAFGIPAANVVKSLPYDGGYIHIIDQTLIPPANIVDVATAANLTSFLSALTTAGLASTVAGLSNVTILAPTNTAFAAIASVAATLTVDQLKTILLTHVISGIVYSTDIIAAKSLPNVATLSTATLDIEFNGTNVLISAAENKSPATVIAADVLADNIVVHVIDTVLLPDLSAPTTAVYSAPSNVYSSAASMFVGAGVTAAASFFF